MPGLFFDRKTAGELKTLSQSHSGSRAHSAYQVFPIYTNLLKDYA